jgi:hypothetical protein
MVHSRIHDSIDKKEGKENEDGFLNYFSDKEVTGIIFR